MKPNTSWNVFLRDNANRLLPCNCGAPELGHSPDCAHILSSDELWEEYHDQLHEYEQSLIFETEMPHLGD